MKVFAFLAIHLSIALFSLSFAFGCFQSQKAPPSLHHFGAKEIAERLCALGPRESCTIGSAVAADWIAEELRIAGLDPIIDLFEDATPAGGKNIFRNVLATINGVGNKHFLLLSHYDTKGGIAPDFIGANDGGSSTALLLALAAYLRTNPIEATVTFAFLDGEEAKISYDGRDGLHGSRHLAGQLRSSAIRLDGVILLDMVGDENLKLTIPVNSSRQLIASLNKAAKELNVENHIVETTIDLLDDHDPFLRVGYPAIDLIDFEYGSFPGGNDYWHTTEDTIDKLSDHSLDIVGSLVLQMIQ